MSRCTIRAYQLATFPTHMCMYMRCVLQRAHLMNAAPYMAHALPIIIPIYKWWEVPYMWVGAKAYDFLAGSKRAVPASYFLNRVRGCS